MEDSFAYDEDGEYGEEQSEREYDSRDNDEPRSSKEEYSQEDEQASEGKEQSGERDFVADIRAYERMSQFAPAAPEFAKALYMQTKSAVEFAKEELVKLLAEYEEPRSETYEIIKERLINLENLHIYNLDLLIVASMFAIEVPSSKNFNKVSLEKFTKKLKTSYQIEDLIRYIRFVYQHI